MRPPTALSLAALDPSGATGLQGDVKTFTALGVYGAAVATGVAGSASGAPGTAALAPELVLAQIEAVLGDLDVDATRLGLVGTVGVAEAIADVTARRRPELGRLVVDPVMTDAQGRPLVTAEAVAVLRERVVPLADVVTPSLAEAAQLLGRDVAADLDGMRDQALALRDLGATVVVLTGGKLPGDEVADVVVHPGGCDVLRSERVRTRNTRGAGSTFSAAVAAQYARIAEYARAGELDEIGEAGPDDDDLTVIASAREFLASALVHGVDWDMGRAPGGRGPVNHLITLDRA